MKPKIRGFGGYQKSLKVGTLQIFGGYIFRFWIPRFLRGPEPVGQQGKVALHPPGVGAQHLQPLLEHVQVLGGPLVVPQELLHLHGEWMDWPVSNSDFGAKSLQILPYLVNYPLRLAHNGAGDDGAEQCLLVLEVLVDVGPVVDEEVQHDLSGKAPKFGFKF